MQASFHGVLLGIETTTNRLHRLLQNEIAASSGAYCYGFAKAESELPGKYMCFVDHVRANLV